MHQEHDSAQVPPPSVPQWNPPPHLEARFSRRRRRNGSGANTPASGCNSQTILTASHLATTRRQSLLEARKSLLRARAQHVEKVRRSKAVSHEAVSERLHALQASMHAAQKSRNAILAKIAGSCASEVAKAKRTAIEMRKRREEETLALKESYEERMIEAQRRRDQVLRERGRKRRDRGSSSSSSRADGSGDEDVPQSIKAVRGVAVKGLHEAIAAKRIQRAWRASRDRKIVADFVSLGLTIESVRDTDFMVISSRFREEEVLRVTSKLVTRCGLLAGNEGIDGAVEMCCRTFLSAYLILGHPGEVLSNDGDKEKVLITRSKDLLIAFESFLSSPSFPPPDTLYNAFSEFSAAFDSWKSRDSEVFIQTMVAQYAELDLIWQKVKDDTTGGVAGDFKKGIRENQLMLLVRIRRLAGDRTRDLIRAAVRESRRTRLPKKEKRDTRPREIPSSESETVSTTPKNQIAPAQPTSPLSSPSSQPQEPPTPDFDNQSNDNDGVVSNRQIIHELALDKDFRLKPHKRSHMEQVIEDVARRAFWDTMRADIAEGKLERWIPALADTVRTKILRLLDPKGSLYRAVSDSMDIDLITQQCRAGSYDHEKLIAYVVDLLPKICSPARDEDVKTLVEDRSDYVSRLQKLLDVLEAMQLDHANFLLMLSAPKVVPEAIPYERRLFAADLEAGRTSLVTTKKWLLAAKSQLPVDSSPENIHVHAFLNLLFDLKTLKSEEIPETFHLDGARLRETREIIQSVILGGAIALTVKTILRRDVRSIWKELKTPLDSLLRESPSSKEVAEGVRTFIEQTTAVPISTLDGAKGAVTRIIERGTADPVVRIVCKRIRGFVRERLLANNSHDKVRLASNAGELLAGWGVGEWIGEVGGVVDRLNVWFAVDRGVSSQWYNEILGVGA